LLASGGDARLAIDPLTGRNTYLCSVLPAPDVVCFSSCTASPISSAGLHAAAACHERLQAGAPRDEAAAIAGRIAAHFGVANIAQAILAPSGTDATLILIGLLAAEQPGLPITSILPCAAETGRGMPLAAAGRHFSAVAGASLDGLPPQTRSLAITLRRREGTVRSAAALDSAYARAAAGVSGRPVIHIVDGSKTGLTAPRDVPAGCDIVVDACQARLDPARLRRYLSRGWPVLVTGSKFYGGPAFSGAVLFPRDRLAAIDLARLPPGLAPYIDLTAGPPGCIANHGALLRWAAALAEMERFAALPPGLAASRAGRLGGAIAEFIALIPALWPVPTPEPLGHDVPTIFSLAVRDPAQRGRLLTADELRPLYHDLARRNFLVGQPVQIGESYGALRVALGARTLRDADAPQKLGRLFAEIERLTYRAAGSPKLNSRSPPSRNTRPPRGNSPAMAGSRTSSPPV
jgi:hypothetical protein